MFSNRFLELGEDFYRISTWGIKNVNFYGDERIFAEGLIPSLRLKLSSLSEFMREIKVNFARFYNRRHVRRGYFWGDRFKSVIVENGATLINCLAYIDLNPLRAGLVQRPARNLKLALNVDWSEKPQWPRILGLFCKSSQFDSIVIVD